MYTNGYRYICMDLDIDIYVRTCILQQGSRCRHGQPQPRARLRGRSRRAPAPCAARACPAATADRCANRACRAAWAHRRLVLRQLSVCTAHGVCAKHREQQGWHEQHKHAHAAQVDSSAHGRWPRLCAGRWVSAPAPTSRIGGSHSRSRRAQAATCDADYTGVGESGDTAWAAADGWLQCRPWLRGRSLRSRPHRAHRRRARPAASTIAREARMPRTCDASVRRALVRSAAKVRPVRVRGGECRARLGGAWLARANRSGCARRNGQRVGLARPGLRQNHCSVQGGALQPSVQ